MLYAVGPVAIEVAPLNVDEYDRSSGVDFAEKPIMGRIPGFEFTGLQAQELSFRGKLFLEALGGEEEWRELEEIQRTGAAQHVMRGDGYALGWFQIVNLRETGRALNAQGVARMIEFEIRLREAAAPRTGQYQDPQRGLVA